jgi:hypothetical protein
MIATLATDHNKKIGVVLWEPRKYSSIPHCVMHIFQFPLHILFYMV